VRKFQLAAVLPAVLAGLAGCGGGDGTSPPMTLPAPSVSRSTEPPYVPSPIKTVTLEDRPGPTTAQTTPSECRYATVEEVEHVVGEIVTRTSVAVGGCWYNLAGGVVLGTAVKITVFRNRVAQLDDGEVAVSGLGGKAFWSEDIGLLEVQAGKNVLWVDVGFIKAVDKQERAEQLLAIVRKRV